MYIHVNQIIENQGPGPYNSLHHTDNIKYFFGSLFNTKSKESMHDPLDEESGRNLEMFLLRKR